MPTRKLIVEYADDLVLFPDRWHKIGLVIWVSTMLAFPFVANHHWLTTGNLAMITIVGATSLMILTGFTGQISLGHAAFLAIGAYTAAVFGNRFGLPFWLILPLAGLLAALVGLCIGPFALRLEGLYLAIVTIGLLFLVNHVLLSFPQYTNGVVGIGVPVHSWFAGSDSGSMLSGFNNTSHVLGLELTFERKLYFLFLVLTLVTVAVATNIKRSASGRAMAAVRDHDVAAAVMGIDHARAKVTAFGVSSFFAGVAGAMFAFQQQYITVEPPFNMMMSIQYISIIVLGGMGTVFGAVAGAMVYTFLSPLLELIGRQLPFLSNLSSGQQSTMLFAIVVCGFLIFEPLGLFGIWLRIKRYFAGWPFRY